MHILVYKAVSQNNVLTKMSTSLAEALARLGVDTTLLALEGSNWIEDVVRTISNAKVDHVVAFGSFTADILTADGRSIYDALGCGLIGWDVDHPAYQFKRFTTPIAKRMQICASDSHVQFAKMMGARTASSLMLPGVDAVAENPLPIAERPYPLTVAMSWLGEPEVWWNGAKGTPAYSLIEGVVSRLLADQAVNLLDAYRATVDDTGIEVRFDENVCNLMANIGLFVRRYDRVNLAKALTGMGIPCVVCGDGWRDRLGEFPHVAYRDGEAFSNLQDLYGKSRVVLNLNAANGASERAVAAMASGAAVVSDYSSLLATQFQAHGGLRFYDRRNPSSLAETLEPILASDETQTLADRGRSLVAQNHLWSHKATRLKEALEGLEA